MRRKIGRRIALVVGVAAELAMVGCAHRPPSRVARAPSPSAPALPAEVPSPGAATPDPQAPNYGPSGGSNSGSVSDYGHSDGQGLPDRSTL